MTGGCKSKTYTFGSAGTGRQSPKTILSLFLALIYEGWHHADLQQGAYVQATLIGSPVIAFSNNDPERFGGSEDNLTRHSPMQRTPPPNSRPSDIF